MADEYLTPDSAPMTWFFWAILSAIFAAATALLAKVGVAGIDSNLATAIRTTVVFVFAWAIAIALERHNAIALIERRSWIFLVLSGLCTVSRGYATSGHSNSGRHRASLRSTN